MNLSRKIFFSGFASGVSIVSGFLRNKIAAAFLSFNLFGILSIAQQSTSLMFTTFAMGLPLGVTVFTSELVRKSIEDQRRLLSQAVTLTALIAAGVLTLISLLSVTDPDLLSEIVTGKSSYAIPVALIMLSSGPMLIESCMVGMMEGLGKLREIVLFKVVPPLLSLPLLYVLASAHGLRGIALAFFLNEVLLVMVGMYLLRSVLVFDRESFAFRGALRSIMNVATLSYGVGVSWLVTDFVIKRSMLAVVGEEGNSVIQSVAKIVDLYPNIALSWLAMHLFPTMALDIKNKQHIAGTLQRTLTVAIAIIIPIILIFFTFRDLVLEVAYKKDFLVASGYLGAMLSTGILRVFAWITGLGFLTIGTRKHWLYSNLIFNVVYALCALVGMKAGFSLYSIPTAIGAASLFQIAYTVVIYRRQEIPFTGAFYPDLALYFVLSGLLVWSVSDSAGLIAAAGLYLGFAFHRGLLAEFRQKLLALAGRLVG